LLSHAGKAPAYRRLRGYAFDPSLSSILDTAEINDVEYHVRWEDVGHGPVGEYVEVIDYDPTTQTAYRPVNLNHPYILAENGMAPSESSPQFHQQMVYAVAMTTIQNFERALGRRVIWAPRRVATDAYEEYVPRLRLYPHALREANAYYSPHKKAVLFGYFSASPANRARLMPGSLVFTCLSHDIIAHEVTHAVLDGLHRHYHRPTNPDVLAFHEAFADIVALFQRFSFPEVLRSQVARTRGDLEKQSLLGQLAQQFGVAIGGYGSLRDALGSYNDATDEWEPARPDPSDYQDALEPHARGSILVAAVFEAFVSIYTNRVADLRRIASGGTGLLPDGELHPDLVNRLAREAAKAAQHVLTMCIRAIDYCPPVDITFGDFLRAVITADADIVTNDNHDYRLAFIDAFRRRGIYPEGIRTLSVESLCYQSPSSALGPQTGLLGIIAGFLREFRHEISFVTDRKEVFDTSRKYIAGESGRAGEQIVGLHRRLQEKFENSCEFEKLTGIIFNLDYHRFKIRGDRLPSFQIHDLRLVSRVGPDGAQINQIVFSLVQRLGVIFDGDEIVEFYTPGDGGPPPGGMEAHGGCTMIFDLEHTRLKYAITKPLLDRDALDRGQHEPDRDRLVEQRRFQNEVHPTTFSEVDLYLSNGDACRVGEPFALLHNSEARSDA